MIKIQFLPPIPPLSFLPSTPAFKFCFQAFNSEQSHLVHKGNRNENAFLKSKGIWKALAL